MTESSPKRRLAPILAVKSRKKERPTYSSLLVCNELGRNYYTSGITKRSKCQSFLYVAVKLGVSVLLGKYYKDSFIHRILPFNILPAESFKSLDKVVPVIKEAEEAAPVLRLVC